MKISFRKMLKWKEYDEGNHPVITFCILRCFQNYMSYNILNDIHAYIIKATAKIVLIIIIPMA